MNTLVKARNKKDQIAKTRIIPVEDLGSEDINFPEFCFGLTGKIKVKDQPQDLVFVDKRNPNAKITLTRGRYGFPNQFTRDLRLALMRIAQRKNHFKDDRFIVNASEILEEMGLSKNGKILTILRNHLEILQDTKITFENAFFDKSQTQMLNRRIRFSIISGYDIVELKTVREKKKDEGKWEGFGGSVIWQQYFFENSLQNAKNLINFDYSFYLSLKGDITKELYQFLNKRKYNKQSLKIELKVLAFEKLGINRSQEDKISKIRYKLKQCHKELISKGFLSREPKFLKQGGTEYVLYNFDVEEVFLDEPKEPEALIPISSQWEELKEKLVALKFTEGQVGRLFRNHSSEQILEALELFEHSAKTSNIKNPKKWIWACLKQEFDNSELVEQKQQIEESKKRAEKEKEERLKQEKLEEEKRELEKIRTQKVDTWIAQNTLEWVKFCENYIENRFESENAGFYKMFLEQVKRKNKEPLDLFMSSPMFNVGVRQEILKKVEESEKVKPVKSMEEFKSRKASLMRVAD